MMNRLIIVVFALSVLLTTGCTSAQSQAFARGFRAGHTGESIASQEKRQLELEIRRLELEKMRLELERVSKPSR